MKTIEPEILADLAIFTPLLLLSATGKKAPDWMILGAFLFASVKAVNLINYVLSDEPISGTGNNNETMAGLKNTPVYKADNHGYGHRL